MGVAQNSLSPNVTGLELIYVTVIARHVVSPWQRDPGSTVCSLWDGGGEKVLPPRRSNWRKEREEGASGAGWPLCWALHL